MIRTGVSEKLFSICCFAERNSAPVRKRLGPRAHLFLFLAVRRIHLEMRRSESNPMLGRFHVW